MTMMSLTQKRRWRFCGSWSFNERSQQDALPAVYDNDLPGDALRSLARQERCGMAHILQVDAATQRGPTGSQQTQLLRRTAEGRVAGGSGGVQVGGRERPARA